MPSVTVDVAAPAKASPLRRVNTFPIDSYIKNAGSRSSQALGRQPTEDQNHSGKHETRRLLPYRITASRRPGQVRRSCHRCPRYRARSIRRGEHGDLVNSAR